MTDPARPGASRPPATLAFHADAYRAGTRHPPHAHEDLHFSLVLSGRVAETVGRVAEYAGALSVVAKDPGVVHANEFGAHGARLARLTLAAGSLGTLVDDPSPAPAWRWTHDPLVAAPFLRLVRRADGRQASFPANDPDLLDLLAAFTARPEKLAQGTPPAWVATIMAEIREAWCPELTVPTLAARAGVHPVYLARCVRRWFQTGVGEELRRQRLRAAAAEITETRRTISDVAHAGGYADEPHFNREFRTALGVTPGWYRKLLGRQDYRWRART